jgi:hypothetical protein
MKKQTYLHRRRLKKHLTWKPERGHKMLSETVSKNTRQQYGLKKTSGKSISTTT